tara:strand:+ start:76 stop:357 length:282 start_codon:yes stop_codon:yes gene_type:complete
MRDLVIFSLNKAAFLKMTKVENDLDIYYVVGNTNTHRQRNEIAAILKKRNYAGWKLIATSTAIVNNKKSVFKSLSILVKELVILLKIFDNICY